ncbi:MAG: hypothetical protein IPK16_01545 [Anaerolineales bacterium]|nr:hypothetical protein [Anaerolineales bacterium]
MASPAGLRQSTTPFAVATPNCYSLTRAHVGRGQDPAATPDHSTACPTGAYVAGAVISLAAAPEYGFAVLSWTGAANSNSSAITNRLTMPAQAHAVTVAYAPQSIPDLIFVDAFESGDLARWATAMIDAGNLAALHDAALTGAYGISANIDDNHPLYVVDRTPSALKRYRARFLFNPNGIQMASGNAHTIFRGFNTVRAVVAIELVRTGSDYGLRASVLNDNLKWVAAPTEPFDGLPIQIEIDWKAASSSATHDGYLDLWLNNVLVAHTDNIDNDLLAVDTVWLGPQAGIDNDTRGVYYFDEFESHETSPIGPVSAAPKRPLAAPTAPQTITAPEAPSDPDGTLAAAPRGLPGVLPTPALDAYAAPGTTADAIAMELIGAQADFTPAGPAATAIAPVDATAGKTPEAAAPRQNAGPVESSQVGSETVSHSWRAAQPIALQLATAGVYVVMAAPAGAAEAVTTTLALSEDYLASDNYLPALPAIVVDIADSAAGNADALSVAGAAGYTETGEPAVLPFAANIRLVPHDPQSLAGLALLRLAPDHRSWEPAGYTMGKDNGEIAFVADRSAVFLVVRPLYGDAYQAYLPVAAR